MKTEILYNGACPICTTEIAQYRKAAAQCDLDLAFRDLNDTDLDDWGLDAEQAARRLHLRRDGQIVSGLAAFVILWQDLPRWRWLARVIALPGIRQIAGLAYDHAAAPLVYRMHKRRQARSRSLREKP